LKGEVYVGTCDSNSSFSLVLPKSVINRFSNINRSLRYYRNS